MRIYIISNVFPPEPVTSAAIAADIAQELVRRGHEVTVFAPFANRPAGRLLAGHRRSWRQVEQRGELRIIRSWHTLSRRSIAPSRLAENLSFGLTSTLQLLRAPRPDVVYMNTWPLFAQYLNARTLAHRSVPVVCAVKDLYPETLGGEAEAWADGRLFRWLRAIDERVYRHSALVAPLNRTSADHLIATRNLAADKVQVWQDWVDNSAFPGSAAAAAGFRARHGLAEGLVLAMYVGSLTRMAGLELYVEAAALLRHRGDIRMLLVGDGAMREALAAQIRARGLTNIEIIHPLAPADVPMVQAAADMLLMSLAPGVALGSTPSKLIYYLFSERPIIGSVEPGSPSDRLIADAGCGRVVRSGNAGQLASCLEELADDPAERVTLGRNAKRYADAHYGRANALPKVCDAIESVGSAAARRTRGAGPIRSTPTVRL